MNSHKRNKFTVPFGNETLKNLYGKHMEGIEPLSYKCEFGSFQINQVTDNDVFLWDFTVFPEHRSNGKSHILLKRAMNTDQVQGKSVHLVAGRYVPRGEDPTVVTPYTNILRLFYEGHGFETIRFIPDWGYYMINHNAD